MSRDGSLVSPDGMHVAQGTLHVMRSAQPWLCLVLMILWNMKAPAFFRGETLPKERT